MSTKPISQSREQSDKPHNIKLTLQNNNYQQRNNILTTQHRFSSGAPIHTEGRLPSPESNMAPTTLDKRWLKRTSAIRDAAMFLSSAVARIATVQSGRLRMVDPAKQQ
jgi:hypothetical protein